MRAIRRNWWARPKIFKKIIKKYLEQKKVTFSLKFCMGTPESHQKSIFNIPKVKKNKDTLWNLSDKACKLNPTT
jgi:hypothetical protein